MFLRSLVISERLCVVSSCSASAWERQAAVAPALVKETAHQPWDRSAIIDIAWRPAEGAQLAAVVKVPDAA
jgi:hypothetical protein